MNVFDAFEDQVSHLFGDVNSAQVPPVSFKKIAKTAVKKMQEAVIDVEGTPVAPVLFTVLVSSGDDALMHSSYGALCEETAVFLKKKIREKGYYLSGKPLVRFMVDPSLKKGKFAVFAETVDTQRLEKLRAEENAFLKHAAPSHMTAPAFEGEEAGLGFVPEDESASAMDAPKPRRMAHAAPSEDEMITPPTQKRSFVGAQVPSRSIAPNANESTLMLIDRSTGRTYSTTNTTVIGRQRQGDNIVINDTNVSRRHAQLSHKGQSWYLEDLGSTNGCQVNGEDIDVAKLKTGDLIVLGVTTLEVRID